MSAVHATLLAARSRWAWTLLAIWLASAVAGFWVFELRDQRPFEAGVGTVFDANARRSSAEDWYRGTLESNEDFVATVLHIYQAGCACNRFTSPHLAKLVEHYGRTRVRFVVATRDDLTIEESAAAGLPRYVINNGPGLDWLKVAPAALVYDARGRLVYFGPYSSSAWCGARGGLVERILDRLLARQEPKLQPFYGGGCFCVSRN